MQNTLVFPNSVSGNLFLMEANQLSQAVQIIGDTCWRRHLLIPKEPQISQIIDIWCKLFMFISYFCYLHFKDVTLTGLSYRTVTKGT